MYGDYGNANKKFWNVKEKVISIGIHLEDANMETAALMIIHAGICECIWECRQTKTGAERYMGIFLTNSIPKPSMIYILPLLTTKKVIAL